MSFQIGCLSNKRKRSEPNIDDATTSPTSNFGDEPFHDMKRNLYAEFMDICSTHKVSNNAKQAFWDFVIKNCDSVQKLKDSGEIDTSYKTLKKQALLGLPKGSLSISVRHQTTGETKSITNLSVFPKKYSTTNNWELRYAITKLSLSEIINYHKSKHGDSNDCAKIVDIGCDGIPLTHTTGGKSLDVTTIRFYGCKSIYPLMLFEAGTTSSLSINDYFKPLVDELNSLGVNVRFIIMDAPFRAYARNLKKPGGYFCCEICTAEGIYKGGTVSYPYMTSTAPFRTHLDYVRIGEELDNNTGKVTQSYGIKGSTPLTNLNNFDLILQIPPDYMHLVCLGVEKRMFENFFGPSTEEKTENMELKSRLKNVNIHLPHIKVPSEFSRTTSKMHVAKLKSEELRNSLLYYYPVILPVLNYSEGSMLSYFSYIMRIMLMPDKYFNLIKTQINLSSTLNTFCRDYLTDGYETYNCHIFRHMLKIRELGVLTEFSALPFESLYGEIKRCCNVCGTNVGKQIVESFFLKRKFKSHHCTNNLKFTPSESKNINDSLIYSNGQFFKIINVDKSKTIFSCHKIRVKDFICPYTGLNLSNSLSFKVLNEDDNEEIIYLNNIDGKAVKVNDIITFVPRNILTEQHC